MITPEQQQAAQQFLKSSGYQPPAGSPASSNTSGTGWYDAVQSQVKQSAPAAPADSTSKQVVDTVNQTGKNWMSEVQGGMNDAATGIKEGADKFSKVPDLEAGSHTPVMEAIKTELAKTGALVGAGADTAVAALRVIFAPLSAAIETASDKASDNPDVQKFAMDHGDLLDAANHVQESIKKLSDAHPELAKNASRVFNLVLGMVGDEGAGMAGDLSKKALDSAKETAQNAGDAIKEGVSNLKDAAGNLIPDKVKNLPQNAVDAAKNARVNMSKANLTDQTQASAERLNQQGIEGTKIPDPVSLYKDYSTSAKAARADIKADPPIGKVGSDIGTAFDKVAKQRRDAGAKMASELEKIGDKPTDVSTAQKNFDTELTKNGLAYDSEEGKLIRSNTSKMTDSDRQLVEDYYTELRKLGPNPTVSHLDAFLSRIPDEMKVYKAKNNITGTTNGERLVKNNLTQLRTQFDPKTTGKSYLKDYADARKQYADLSSFLDDGVKFLGKKTASGDYAKDASLAKSSVQSILNNGKKDWLMKLEALTGDPLLDKSVLALQAMKDAGDPRAASLLEQMAKMTGDGKSPIPTTKGGLIERFVGGAIKKGHQMVVGSPEEQTIRYLESLQNESPKK